MPGRTLPDTACWGRNGVSEVGAQEYTRRLRDAFATSRPWIYDGREGALRLAREYGSGLADSPEREALEAMRESYIQLCVMGYNMNPPINADEWYQEVKNSYERRRKTKDEPAKKHR